MHAVYSRLDEVQKLEDLTEAGRSKVMTDHGSSIIKHKERHNVALGGWRNFVS